MANRFTNTSKWQDDWFLSLSNDYRIIWQYLNDHCSIVGVWKKGVKHLNYFCNTSITEDELKKNFAEKIIDCGEYFFIPSFLKDQYPGKLNEKSGKPIIQGVFKEIRALNLFSIIKESLGDDFLIIKESLDNDCEIIKEKETGNGKGNGKRKLEKEIGGVGEKIEKLEVILPFHEPEFERAWNGWKEYKKAQFKFTFKGEHSEQIALKGLAELARNDCTTALRIIEQSMANGWKGFFELKNGTHGKFTGANLTLSPEYRADLERRIRS